MSVKINGISKTYSKGNKAVDDLSLTINDGEIFGLIGPNGAGKSTTLRMMTGILNPDCGSIEIDGVDLGKQPVEAKRRFGYVPDSPDIFLKLKGVEYLNLVADIYGVSSERRKAAIVELAETFEMSEVLGNAISSYSHGMRQKIILIGALLHDPKVWILDEPMTGLDPRSSFLLKEMMRRHADKGNSVIFSTHVLEVAEKVCDRLAIISAGKVIFCGTMQELRQKAGENGSLESLFLELTDNGGSDERK